MIKRYLLIFFLININFVCAIADDAMSDLNPVSQLNEKQEHREIILSIPDEYYQKNETRYIALHPETQRVNITAQHIEYTEEAESFARHRRHYVAFWSLFLIMFGVDILWAE